ncbi:MAG: murein transglycosylase [Cellulomonas sp. 14-74-6]|jgi:LysM repeat protein|nr:MAG: murein transglycosylase [Cellulomonas sp. 14-74-6]
MTDTATARATARRRAATGTGATLALTAVTVAVAAPAQADTQYTVRTGDTVSHIAQRAGVSVAAISRANALADASRIRAGQVLTIPGPAAPAAAAPAARAAAPTITGTVRATYTVVKGDTVSRIAARTGSSVAAIVAANNLDGRAFIRIGQVLTIPSATGAPAAAVTTVSATVATVPTVKAVSAPTSVSRYTVVPGDTLSAIASRFGTTVAAVAAANGLDSRGLIRIGQGLDVPGATVATAKPLVGDTFAGRTYPAVVVGAANVNKAALLATGVPSPAQMRALVASTARTLGVDPALALAVAYQESGFDQTSVSPANAIGTMQVIPSSGEWASQMAGRSLNLLDPQDNVTAGVLILRSLVRTAPDLPSAIAGYYQGLTSVQKSGMFPDTRRYVANVQTLMTRFR